VTDEPTCDRTEFDRRLLPTGGVARLLVEALLDLVLLIPRVLIAATRAGARRRAVAALIRARAPHAT
jgi:hypothetical protein